MSAEPFPTDRRMLAAQMCHILAHGAEDPSVSLEHLGKAAQQIAAFLLDEEQSAGRHGQGRPFRVIEGGRQ